MKISERQIHDLICIAYYVMSMSDITQSYRDNVGNLLRDIKNQQSGEVKEIE